MGGGEVKRRELRDKSALGKRKGGEGERGDGEGGDDSQSERRRRGPRKA